MKDRAVAAITKTDMDGQNKTKLSYFERIKINCISGLGYWIIRIICSTLRWKVKDWQNLESIHKAGKRFIVAFWHGRIFMAIYFLRQRGIVVMTSQNRDGEYISRVIQRFGYGAARGSSTRGSRGAVVEMLLALKRNRDVAITLDGPQGPRYIAKPGAAYVAWKSGNPVMPATVSVEKKWVMRSWDHFIVPKPFSRALLIIGAPIYVDANATEEEIQLIEERIQHSMEQLRNCSDTYWGGEADH